jgi:hypothetical protein
MFVKPAMMDARGVAAHYALRSLFEPYPENDRVYCLRIQRDDFDVHEAGRAKVLIGRAHITAETTQESEVYSFGALHMGSHLMNAGVRIYRGEEQYNTLKQDLIEPFARGDFPEVLRLLDRHFSGFTFSLRSIFRDDQRRILDILLHSALEDAEATYRRLYEDHLPMTRFLGDLRIPLPQAFGQAAVSAINSSLRKAFENTDNLDRARIRSLTQEARQSGVRLDAAALGFALQKTITVLAEQLAKSPFDLEIMKKLETAAEAAKDHSLDVQLWRAQNIYFRIMQSTFHDVSGDAERGDAPAQEWVERFMRVGHYLSVRVVRTQKAPAR